MSEILTEKSNLIIVILISFACSIIYLSGERKFFWINNIIFFYIILHFKKFEKIYYFYYVKLYININNFNKFTKFRQK